MDEICEECGKIITRRGKANIWRGEHVVCTPCLNLLKGWEEFGKNVIEWFGKPNALWWVDGHEGLGQLTDEQVADLLRARRIDYQTNLYRDGMEGWKPAGRIFSVAFPTGNEPIKVMAFERTGPRPKLL